jgi:hypothetical protein
MTAAALSAFSIFAVQVRPLIVGWREERGLRARVALIQAGWLT